MSKSIGRARSSSVGRAPVISCSWTTAASCRLKKGTTREDVCLRHRPDRRRLGRSRPPALERRYRLKGVIEVGRNQFEPGCPLEDAADTVDLAIDVSPAPSGVDPLLLDRPQSLRPHVIDQAVAEEFFEGFNAIR
jgi:hypothetical protein